MTLQEFINKNLVWNKEKIQVRIDDTNTTSRVDRIEFLADEFSDYTVDWFESSTGEYDYDEIPIIIFHVSLEVKSNE